MTEGNAMHRTEVPLWTSMPPSPSAPPKGRAALGTVDIVVLVVYFLFILAVGFWVSVALC